MKSTILIVDDESKIRSSLKGGLEDEGYEILLADNGEAALKSVDSQEIDLVLLDIWMPGMDGLQVLQEIKKSNPGIPVIIMTGHGSIENAVKATKLGAHDFIEKPLDLNRLILSITNAIEFKTLSEERDLYRKKASEKDDEIIGESSQVASLKEQIDLAARSDSWILILGENGTGKELVARSLHYKSQRADKTFVEVNCAAIPGDLIESELFGHEKGAFTGATERKRGKFDLANKGTLFLDEIGDMSFSAQAKVLRILQEQKFERVGGSQTIHVDVRVLTATNKNLTEEIAAGRFRQDLYYRLDVIPINVPPLRERKEDIPLLTEHFLKAYAPLKHGVKKSITEGAIKKLMLHDWPGNVRELKNIIERLVIMTPGNTITAENVPNLASTVTDTSGQNFGTIFEIDKFKDATAEFQKLFIEHKLAACSNNITKTAELIGVERSNLHRKLKDLGIGDESS